MRARQADGNYKCFFFVTNTHGDVVALSDRCGNIANRYAYGPWGEATRVSEQMHQPFRCAGYRYEDDFDLYYLRARWMDPGTGRFVSRDPARGSAARIPSLNRYTYAFGSPVTHTDDCGRSPSRPRRLPAAMWPHLCHLGHRLSEASDLEWGIAVASIKLLVQDWYEHVDVCDIADSEYGLENLLHEFWHAEQHAVDGGRFVRAFPGGGEIGSEAAAYEDDAYRNASRILGAFVATYRPL